MGHETRPCPQCGQLPGPGLVLAGWLPCSCPARGHSTPYCRPDVSGCGFTRHEPELDDATCKALSQIAPAAKRRRTDFVRQAVKEAIRREEFARMREAYQEQPDSDADDWSNAESFLA